MGNSSQLKLNGLVCQVGDGESFWQNVSLDTTDLSIYGKVANFMLKQLIHVFIVTVSSWEIYTSYRKQSDKKMLTVPSFQ